MLLDDHASLPKGLGADTLTGGGEHPARSPQFAWYYQYKSVLEECRERHDRLPLEVEPDTAELAVSQLENKLTRASAALDSISTKAVAMVAGVLTVATVLVTGRHGNLLANGWTTVGTALALVGGFSALVLSVATLWSQEHGNAADPALLGEHLGSPTPDMLRAVFAALDIAVTSTERLGRWKAFLLNCSMVAGVVGFVGIITVALAGG